MSLYLRNKVWWSRIVRHGKVYFKSLEVGNKNTARLLESKWRQELALNEAGLGPSVTIDELVTRFLNYAVVHCKSRDTWVHYAWGLKRFRDIPGFMETKLDRVNADLIENATQILIKRGLAVSTVNASLRSLRRAFNLAREWNLARNLPKVKCLPNENQREFVISDADENKLVAAADLVMTKLYIPFMIDTGLRRGESCRLTMDDIEANEAAILVRKGKSRFARRRIPLTDRAAETIRYLRSLARPTGFVFTRRGKYAITLKWASANFNKARRAAGLPDECVLHSTRHTFCSRLGAAGCSPYELQRLAGHSNITISARYCHPDNPQLDAAIARLKK